VLQNQATVTVVHRETGFSFGVMRTKTGGGKEGDNQLVRPGGMAPPEAFPGTYEFGEVECTRLIRHGTDSGLVQRAWDLHAERFDIVEQPKDSKGRAGFHRAQTYTGLLNTSTPPEYDADGNDPSELTMAFTIDGTA
jgi:hypothetical protein